MRLRASLSLLSAAVFSLAVAAAACGRAAATSPAAGPPLPAGCGPRDLPQGVAVGPAAPSAGPLPAYGAPLDAQGLGAGTGGTLYASTWNALYTSGDGGAQWAPLPLPAGITYGLQPLLGGSGGRVAGVIGDLLEVSTDGGHTWHTAPPVNLFALATDPAAPDALAALGGTMGPKGTSTLFLSGDWGATWRDLPLGTPLLGSAVALVRGTAWAAVGSADGPARLFEADLAGSGPAVPWSPAPPAASAGAVLGLAATPGGRALLLTAGGLWVSDGPGAAWTAVPLPAGPPLRYLATLGRAWFVVQDAAGNASGRLWESVDGGQSWRAVPVPPGYLGQPVAAGGHLWVPGEGGPYRVGAAGAPGAYRAAGIPAPISFVASAARRPDLVAAGWSGGWLVSTDGGAHFTYTVPPGSNPLVSAQVQWTPDGGCLVALFAQEGPSPQDTPNAFVSGDAGRHWTALPAPAPGGIGALAEFPAGSGVWWAAVQGRLYRTAPGVAAWRRVPLPAGAPTPRNLAAGGRLWLQSGTQGGLWSAGAGPAGLAAPAPAWGAGFLGAAVAVDPYNPAVVYAGIARTLDGGAHWQTAAAGPAAWVPGQTWPRQPDGIAFLPGSPGALLADAQRLLRDTGAGGWQTVWQVPTQGDFITGVAPAGPGLAYVAVQGVGLVRVAAGGAWQAPAPPPGAGAWTVPAGWPVLPALSAADPAAPAIVYRVTPAGALSRSSDGGAHFGPAAATGCCLGPVGLRGGVSTTALAVSPSDPALLMLGLGRPPGTGTAAGLLLSADGGRTWQRSGLPPGESVTGIAMASSSRAYAAAGGNLWATTDGGRTWRVLAGPQGVLSVAAGRGGAVLAGGRTAGADGAAAVWISGDGGATLRESTVDPPLWRLSGGVSAVLRLADGTLLAGGSGLAESTDGGATWHDVSASVGDPAVEPGGLQPTAAGGIAVRTADGTYTYRP